MVTVAAARAAGRDWVSANAAGLPGFQGAFFAGSTDRRSDDEELPATSDVDVMVVTAADPPARIGKLRHRGVLLDVTHLPVDRVASPEAVLGDYHVAASFHAATLITDPSGRLAALQRAVSQAYADPDRARHRYEQAIGRVETRLHALDPGATLHHQVIGWLFGTGVTTHVLLVAGLRPPTVRRRYAAVRELLHEHHAPEVHERLLGLLGAAGLDRAGVERHLDASRPSSTGPCTSREPRSRSHRTSRSRHDRSRSTAAVS